MPPLYLQVVEEISVFCKMQQGLYPFQMRSLRLAACLCDAISRWLHKASL